jgi:hypothetical protein
VVGLRDAENVNTLREATVPWQLVPNGVAMLDIMIPHACSPADACHLAIVGAIADAHPHTGARAGVYRAEVSFTHGELEATTLRFIVRIRSALI